MPNLKFRSIQFSGTTPAIDGARNRMAVRFDIDDAAPFANSSRRFR
jgi:hypothetical protein